MEAGRSHEVFPELVTKRWPYFLKMEVLEVQTLPIVLDFPPNFRRITWNPFSLHCVETVLPIFC